MRTHGDIRTRFDVALNENQKYSQNLSKVIRDILLKNKIRGNKNQNLSELRFGISGDSKITMQYIKENILKGIKDIHYTVTFEGPDRAKKGDAKSGTYNTYKITIINPVKVGKYKASPGEITYIIDNLKAQSNIQNKMLTPDGLGLGGKQFKNLDEVKDIVDRELKKLVKSESISEPHREYMILLIDSLRTIS